MGEKPKKPKKPKKKDMAITVSDSNNQLTACEATTGFASDGGGGAGPQNEPDLVYQNTQSVSRKIGTTLGGLGYTHGSTVDMTVAADSIVMMKGVWSNSAALVAAPSAQLKIGNSSTVAWRYQIADDGSRGDIDAPPTRLWVVSMITPAVSAWRDFIDGSPSITTIDFFGIQGDFSTASKAENVAIDAIDISPGLWLVGNTPDGTWLDFKDYDEDTVTNRFGHFVTVGNTFFLQGLFVIGRNSAGTVSATTFTDGNRIIEFPPTRTSQGQVGIEVDCGNASTVVTMSSMVFTGAGRFGATRWFDSSSDEVDGALEEIIIADHGFKTGDNAQYNHQGGTNLSGLTDGTQYFIRAVSTSRIALYQHSSGRDAAYSDTSRINLTAAGAGQQHRLLGGPITMPYFTVIGTSGSCLFTGCTFNGIGVVDFTSAGSIVDSVFNVVHRINLDDGATLDGVTINGAVRTEGEAVVRTPNPEDITNCIFNASSNGGHAIEVESAGTYDLDNIEFNNYGPGPAEFDGVTDVNTSTEHITLPSGHGYVTGDAVYYNDRGNTQITGLVDQTRYYINVDTNSISLHVTKADAVANANLVNLTGTQTGTHAIEHANAAIYNSTGSSVTLNIINGGSVPSVRNSAGSSTTVNNAVTVTISGLTEGTPVKVTANETVGTVTIGDTLFDGVANNAGVASYSQNYEGAFGAGLDVIIRARNQGVAIAAIAEDNAVFVDETLQAISNTSADQNLLPAVPVASQDYYYWGHDEQFDSLKLFISTAGVGTYTLTWQYWNGAWTSLSGVVDGTSDYKTLGGNKVSFTIPGDWATTTINGQGPFKYIRASLNAGTVTTVPKASRSALNVTRYLPFQQNNTITTTGLTTVASWVEDGISTF